VAAIAVVLYQALTAAIVRVPREFPLGFMKVLPLSYWFAVGLSVVLLLLALASNVGNYLWVSAVLLIILVPGLGDLTQPNPRDVFSMIAAERISQAGWFNPSENVYLNFPGAAVLFSSLVVVTGAPSEIVVRMFGVIYNVILFGLGFLFFRRTRMTPTASLLSALLVVFCFYHQGVLIYTSLMGYLFYVLLAGIVFASESNSSIDFMLLMAFYMAMVVSHAFSPFLTLAAMTALLVGWRIAEPLLRRLRLGALLGDPPSMTMWVLVPAVLVVLTYWAYFAFRPFTWGLLKLESTQLTSRVAGAGGPILSPTTGFATTYSHLAELYAPMLLVVFVLYLILWYDGRKLQLLLWIAGLGGAVVISLAGYVEEFFARIFSFAVIPLSYGAGRLFDMNRRLLRVAVVGALLVALVLHLPAHYGQDAFLLVPDSTIQGECFFANHSFVNASVDAPVSELSWHYYIDLYRQWNAEGPGSYYVLNYEAESWILYSEGQTSVDSLNEGLNSSHYDKVMSNGGFRIYSENET